MHRGYQVFQKFTKGYCVNCRYTLRGIVSTVCTSFERISRYLIQILRTIQGRNGLFVKNSRRLRKNGKDWRLEEDEILVSYDVKNLYPSVPIKKAVQLVERLLKESRTLKDVTELSVDSIMSLLRWMFSFTYCEYNGQHFVLGSGPIGLGTTGEVAIIYMVEFQIQAIKTSPYPLEHWYWYVDGSELKCRTEDSERILEHLNAIEEGVIVFTKEEQHEGSSPDLI